MDFDENEERKEEIGMAEAAGYDSLGNSSARSRSGGGGVGAASTATATPRKSGVVRYKECLKNHAVSIGEHAVDGCGEFMAAGDEGTLDALKCAACSCHRNFHRKETEGESSYTLHHHHLHHQQHHLQFYRPPPPAGYLHLTPTPRPLALPSASGGGGYSREEEDVSNPSSSGGGGSGLKKRFRTKFTQEQKDTMLAFAERLGWRIQKHDDAAVEQFCAETGVKRHVFKVWMHNNKHSLGKKP